VLSISRVYVPLLLDFAFPASFVFIFADPISQGLCIICLSDTLVSTLLCAEHERSTGTLQVNFHRV